MPEIPGVRDLIAGGFVAGGTQRNHAFVSEFVDWGSATEADQLLLADAQTSGGLLFAVAPDRAEDLVRELKAEGTLAAAAIGTMNATESGRVHIH